MKSCSVSLLSWLFSLERMGALSVISYCIVGFQVLLKLGVGICRKFDR